MIPECLHHPLSYPSVRIDKKTLSMVVEEELEGSIEEIAEGQSLNVLKVSRVLSHAAHVVETCRTPRPRATICYPVASTSSLMLCSFGNSASLVSGD